MHWMGEGKSHLDEWEMGWCVFSDEKKFNLDDLDGDKELIFSKKPFDQWWLWVGVPFLQKERWNY